MGGRTLVFDIETHSAKLLYTLPPEAFVRLIGYKWTGGTEVRITTDLGELREAIQSARWIIGHNIHAFDLKAVFGPASDIPLRLADEGRVYDTWTHAPLVYPAPPVYENRQGKKAKATNPGELKKFFGLDELAYQLGVSGKTADLKELAAKYPTEGYEIPIAGSDRVFTVSAKDAAFGNIPTDDEDYRAYLVGDVEASERVARELLRHGPLDDYAIREQRIAARAAVISSNGFRVDIPRAEARVAELSGRRDEIMADLQARYDFPTEGKSPWATTQGKEAILKALADAGVSETTRPDWPRTEKGNLKLGGKELIELTKGTEAEELGQALAELKGQRSLAQLALDSVHPDGKVHPDITMLQRSGRWSTTDPGLTVWTSRGEGAVEKSYFVPDSEGEAMMEIDYSNADARVVAWLSGDREYAKRFEPGADGHLINAWAAWGKEVVGTDKHHPVTAGYRQKAKPLGHGWSYGGQAKTLSRMSGVPFEDAKTFCDGMAKQFRRLVRWQDAARKEAQHGYVMNPWGRKMFVEKGREFTQAPALKGQSGTREVICDALLGMSYAALRAVKAQIHDALLFSVPRARFEACRDYLLGVMETSMKATPGGQPMEFPAEAGPPGSNWLEAHPE